MQVKRISIDNVYRLKDGRFLISESNKLKIYKYNENNDKLNFDLDFEFSEFSKNNKISSFLELIKGKLLFLSEGIITIFKKLKNNLYQIYKNNFHLLEKIYSMAEFNEKAFVTFSEIKGEERCCHLKIWDSETFSLTYNSNRHYRFPKHQSNILKITNDLIMVMIDRSEITNYSFVFLLFNIENKTFEIDKNHYNFSRIIKISDGCFIGILKGAIGQYELIHKNNFIKSTNIGFKEIEFENKILKLFIMLLFLRKI